MNKSNLKKFAIEARQELREKTKAQLKRLGIEEKKIEEGKDMGSQVEIYGKLYSKSSYQHLLVKYHSLGYEELVEESAYLWFNRLTALAYMELHDCFTEHMIFSKGNKGEPDILDEYFQADFFQKMPLEKQEELHQLRDKNTSDSLETLYSILMEEKCEELSKIMPFLFSKKGKYADILFPSGLLMQDSVLKKLQVILLEIQEEEQSIPVEILGWLYQYYNSEKKDEVFARLKKNQKVTKENIPAATQLFTPHWIVKYMVENSLGKLILEHIPNMEAIKKDWNYYIETEIESSSEKLSIESIKILDPAMGSGHMLTYAFDILFDVYQELGWSKKESVFSILQNNLYGLEIDDRAGQLAAFALLMKGKEKFPRLFQVLEREENFEMPVISLQESNAISKRMYTMLEECPTLQDLLKGFEDAKEYGSILKIDSFEENILQEEYQKLQEKIQNQGQFSLLNNNDFLEGDLEEDLERLEHIIRQYKIMIQKYDVVITNPPYMGGRGFSPKLKNYTEKNYKDSKSDLFSVFMEVCQGFTKKNRYTAMITMQSWMFLSSFETLRNHMITKTEIQSLNHLGARAFSELAGEVVQTVAWVQKHKIPEKKGKYIRLVDYNNAEEKEREFFNKENYYQANQKDFTKIPGSPIAYWVSDRIREIFEKEKKLGEVGEAKQGLATADNNRFLRIWNETNFNKIGFGMKNSEEALKSGKKWFPCNKGGEYRKWYGNQEYVVNWEKDGYEIKNFYDSNGKLRSRPQNTEYYFKEALTWSTVSSSNCSFRYSSIGHLFETKGSNYFVKERNNLYYLFGLLNTKLINYLLKVLSPTLDYHEGPMSKLPVILLKQNLKISNLVSENITITKQEWDSRETSWDFERLSLLNGKTVKEAYDNYCNYWTEQFVQMHKNEEELNRIFIDIYGLQEEMDEKVEFSDITLLKKEASIIENTDSATSYGYLENRGVRLEFHSLELVKQFLSYAIGCIMGRYSLDKPGLILANSDDVLSMSSNKITVSGVDGEIRHEILNPSFFPEEFGILSVTTEERFENDIVSRVIAFISAVYGKERLEENLEFITEILGKKAGESHEEVLRNYFIKDFYTDHCQRYQKRPIYWMLHSGKKNGFSALIYLHRYEKDTIARVRSDYLLPYQEFMEQQEAHYSKIASDEISTPKEKKDAQKKGKELHDILKELKDYANKVKHIAEQRISLDLDDGVKVNYEKLGSVLKKI
ncbi:BREX-1 system adenine-specific DNA-methyltransferase PglX [Fusobacterium necrophorum]|uniref:site-specific DNA-methyltransferase (adenine-specific) n=1 Tax=Fusobacterium necrophorum DJ-2 TaxID=1441737 RepID=A0AB73C2Z8_9FUSO|nr:BREX-1 system adenine-specific DNA-methyltransferase PglX [Fusobacterium necrophorum]KDE62583.1 restriction endonuclease [Fusobacterium necrophorum DJ-1]KDE72120.1 restriction endonuclease [Fusobacterium necrophorum DJ-2]MCF0162781.1 BREX-1 system adenine-specific DNA-methyltransferase PglX [Fusobacterium necrophorum]